MQRGINIAAAAPPSPPKNTSTMTQEPSAVTNFDGRRQTAHSRDIEKRLKQAWVTYLNGWDEQEQVITQWKIEV